MANKTLPTRSLSDFKAKLGAGGARPNLFEVDVKFPPGINLNVQGDALNGDMNNPKIQEEFTFLCKAASLPASTVANIDIPFRGRTFKVAGDRTFEAWTITVINDENFGIYKSFQSWMQNVAQYGDAAGLTTPSSYMGNGFVSQLGRSKVGAQGASGSSAASTVLAEYQFVDIWPSTVSNIDLSYDSSDAIEEFTVDLQVQYWYPLVAGGVSNPAATAATTAGN